MEIKRKTNGGGGDYWVIKIDSLGNKQWDKDFGGTSVENFVSLAAVSSNKYLVGGTSFSGVSGNKTLPNKGGTDFWVILLDSIGNKLWENVIGGVNGADYLYYIYPMSDNGYLLSGYSYSSISGDKTENNLGNSQAWIVKLDSTGAKQWDKTIFTTANDGAAVVAFPDDGCYVIAVSTLAGIGGYKTQANWDTTEQTKDYWIMKFCMDTVVGIGDEAMDDEGGIQIQVYPNPFTTDLSIGLKAPFGGLGAATFTITNALGQVIYKREENNLSSNYTKMLDLSYLPNGFYFITVTQNGELFTKKVVKE